MFLKLTKILPFVALMTIYTSPFVHIVNGADLAANYNVIAIMTRKVIGNLERSSQDTTWQSSARGFLWLSS